jgi:signal transduction histidine kinase
MSSTSDENDGRSPPLAGENSPLERDGLTRQTRLDYFDLTSADAERLRDYRLGAEPELDGIIEAFYAHLLAFPQLETLLRADPARVARLQGLQRDYFLSLTDAHFDDAFFASRSRIGATHAAIGVDPTWYFGAFALYFRLILRRLVDATDDGRRILPTLEALIKAIFLDVSLTMRAYIVGGFVDKDIASRLAASAKLAEDAMRAQSETDRLKDELGTMVVHDLKNPVNGIKMLVQLALRKGADLPEAHRGYLSQIQRTCDEMMRLIENLLHIAKIEEGRMPVTHEAVGLGELIAEVASEYQSASTEIGRPLVITVPTDLPSVLGDRALLKRVLVNLVVNALRHSASATVEVDAAIDGHDQIACRVIDRGRGIPKAMQTKVFEKFASLPPSPADGPRSDTGLGLPFCKMAVEEMGGVITLDSAPGKGTTFTVRLPVFRPAP